MSDALLWNLDEAARQLGGITENLMRPQDEPESSSSKKGVIFFLVLAWAIFLVEKMCFSEFRIGIGIVALAALEGVALYLTH